MRNALDNAGQHARDTMSYVHQNFPKTLEFNEEQEGEEALQKNTPEESNASSDENSREPNKQSLFNSNRQDRQRINQLEEEINASKTNLSTYVQRRNEVVALKVEIVSA